MLYSARVGLRSPGVNTCYDKLFRKEAMTFINLFGNLAAHIGQMEKVIFIHCEKAVGYERPESFAKQFHRITGLLPREYRKLVK